MLNLLKNGDKSESESNIQHANWQETRQHVDIGMQLKMNMDDFKVRANKIVFNWCINRNLPVSQLELLSTGFETNPDGTTNYVANYVIGFFKKKIAYHECDKKHILN